MYPAVHVTPLPDMAGVMFHILLGPYTSLSQMVDGPSFTALAKQWLTGLKEMRKQQETELAVIRHVNTHKN